MGNKDDDGWYDSVNLLNSREPRSSSRFSSSVDSGPPWRIEGTRPIPEGRLEKKEEEKKNKEIIARRKCDREKYIVRKRGTPPSAHGTLIYFSEYAIVIITI